MEIIEQLRSQSDQFFWSPKINLNKSREKGISVVCVEPLQPNEVVINVPANLLVNVSTIGDQSPETELSTHELLALEIIRRKKGQQDKWVLSLPESFDSMPMNFTSEDEAPLNWLPDRYQTRIATQIEEVNSFASKCEVSIDEARWAWQVVNTRCLYWEDGGMTLAPGVDYLNHICDISGTESVRVIPSAEGIKVETQRHYEIGDELSFCYGPHENAFLLVEYGFTVPSNPWNFADITRQLIPLVDSHRQWLDENGYWGDWTVDKEGIPSFRVEVALATLHAPSERALNALISGYDDSSRYEDKNYKVIASVARAISSQLNESARGRRIIDENIARLVNEYISILNSVVKKGGQC